MWGPWIQVGQNICKMRFIAAVAAAVAVGVCADPLVGSDADGNLHINASEFPACAQKGRAK